MSTFASKFNKQRKFEIDTKDFEYLSLADLFNDNGKEKVYPMYACYINKKSKFGDAPVVATDSFFVNAPSHMLDTFKAILEDEEACNSINNGDVGFKIYAYHNSQFDRDCYGVEFVDMK